MFETIFENFLDVPSFKRAIADSRPNENKKMEVIKKKEQQIKLLVKAFKQRDSIVDTIANGTITETEAHSKLSELRLTKDNLQDEITSLDHQINTMPDVEVVKEQAEQIRRQLALEYSGKNRLQKMTFSEKRELLHWLFEGSAPNSDKYGIYITRRGKYSTIEVDYFMFERIVGLRTLKGDYIDYFNDEWLKDKAHICKSDSMEHYEWRKLKIIGMKKRTGWDGKRKPKYTPQDFGFDD